MVVRDGDWTLYDYDMRTGRSVWKFTHDDGRVTFRTDYPVDHIVKGNQNEMAANSGKRWGDGKIAARIPLNLLYDELMPAILQDDDKYVSKWLNDGDNAAFRTFGGRV